MKSKKCPVCKQEIRGWNDKMIDYNMEVHIKQKHPKPDTKPEYYRRKE